jgi:hypothetical protein
MWVYVPLLYPSPSITHLPAGTSTERKSLLRLDHPETLTVLSARCQAAECYRALSLSSSNLEPLTGKPEVVSTKLSPCRIVISPALSDPSVMIEGLPLLNRATCLTITFLTGSSVLNFNTPDRGISQI